MNDKTTWCYIWYSEALPIVIKHQIILLLKYNKIGCFYVVIGCVWLIQTLQYIIAQLQVLSYYHKICNNCILDKTFATVITYGRRDQLTLVCGMQLDCQEQCAWGNVRHMHGVVVDCIFFSCSFIIILLCWKN